VGEEAAEALQNIMSSVFPPPLLFNCARQLHGNSTDRFSQTLQVVVACFEELLSRSRGSAMLPPPLPPPSPSSQSALFIEDCCFLSCCVL
jgi:hypothetical protein